MQPAADTGVVDVLPLEGHGFYLAGDDNLRLTVFNALVGVSVTVAGRFQHPDGRVEPFEHRITPTSDRVATVITRRLARGWILNLHVYASAGAPLTGQTFAIASIVRGQSGGVIELATLAAGYVTATQRLAWPSGLVLNSLEGGGALRSITGATPGAGVEVSETVPTGARWELLAFQAQLVTAVAAANRATSLSLDDGATVYVSLPAKFVQTASLTFFYVWAQGLQNLQDATRITNQSPLPTNLRMGAGHRIKTATSAIQGADQFSAVQYLVREWIEGA